jgi:hypothetical protein
MNTSLEHLKESARRAHYWTSFVPDKRAEQTISEHQQQLDADIEELQGHAVPEDIISDYKTRFVSLFSQWLGKRSRCASTMITGSANFNVRRAEKANRSEENFYNVFQQWRERAKRAIIRKQQPAKTFTTELDRYTQELESLKKNHELMKQGNKRIKEANKTGEDLTQYLTDMFGIRPHMIDWTMKFGFGLANSSANIRRVEERIKLMQSKQEQAEQAPQRRIEIMGGFIILNYEADRIQVSHDTKPEPETIQQLKRNGFKWAPSVKVWQRQLTPSALSATRQLFKIEL